MRTREDRVRRLTSDRGDGVTRPAEFERVPAGRLSRGDRVLLRPGEPIPADGTLVAVPDGRDGAGTGVFVETRDGTRERRAPGEAVERDGVVRGASVVVEVRGRPLPWWLRAASPAGILGRPEAKRVALAGFIVLALLGAGLGILGPIGPAPDDPYPGGTASSAPPRMTVTPPGTGSTAPSGTAVPGGTDTDATDPPATSPATGTPVDAALSVRADDPPMISDDDGAVGTVTGRVGGTLRWSVPRVDSVVLVLQTWVPGHGWRERERVTVEPDGAPASPVDLGAVFGEVTYASGARADAYENPSPGTTRTGVGSAAVTAVLFEDGVEVARERSVDGFRVSVRHPALGGDGGGGGGSRAGVDLELGGAGDGGSIVPLMSVDGAVPGGRWVGRGNLTNAGDVPGEVRLDDVTITSYENGLAEAEAAVDDTGGDPGPGAGELAGALDVRVSVVGEGSRRYVFGNVSAYRPLPELGDEPIVIAELDPGETVTLVVEYRLGSGVGSEIQTDGVGIDFGFTMVET